MTRARFLSAPTTVERSLFHAIKTLRNQLFKRVNILLLDLLLPSWSPRDETITMAVVLSCSGVLRCETLS